MPKPQLQLPPGAVLVSDNSSGQMALPPGATLVNQVNSTPAVTSEIKAAPKMGSWNWIKEKFYNGVDRGSNMLPGVFGFAGGLIGTGGGIPSGPGAVATGIGGAALGGSAGEATRQLIRRGMGWEAPQTSLAAAKDIGIEGVKQGALEATGQVIGRLGRAVAPRLAETAMAPGKRLLKSVGENVNIGKTVLNETNAVKPKTITQQLKNKAANAESQLEELTAQADRRYTIKPKGLLKPAPTEVPLGKAPTAGEMPGELVEAELFPRRNIVGGEPTTHNIEQLGSTASTVPANLQRGFYKAGNGQSALNAPEITGPGVLLSRDPAFQTRVTGKYVPKLAEGAPSLTPARDVVSEALAAAEYRNSEPAAKALRDLLKPLTTDIKTGEVIPEQVLPSKIRAMKQGIGERISSWNPETQSLPAVQRAKELTYGALDKEFNAAVPGSDAIDKSLSQLIPAKEAAWNVSYNPSITRNLFNRFARPTGALAGAGFGAYTGGQQGGTGGAIIGGLTGLAAPELIASPTGQMILARLFQSKVTPQVVVNGMRLTDALVKPTAEDEKRRKLLNQAAPQSQ